MNNVDYGMEAKQNAGREPCADDGDQQPDEVPGSGRTSFGPPEYPGADVPVRPDDNGERGQVGQVTEGYCHHPIHILPCALSADPDKRGTCPQSWNFGTLPESTVAAARSTACRSRFLAVRSIRCWVPPVAEKRQHCE